MYLNERHQEWEKLKAHLNNTLDGSQIECCCLECQMGSWNTINSDSKNRTLMVHMTKDSRMSSLGTQDEVIFKKNIIHQTILYGIYVWEPTKLTTTYVLKPIKLFNMF